MSCICAGYAKCGRRHSLERLGVMCCVGGWVVYFGMMSEGVRVEQRVNE